MAMSATCSALRGCCARF
ncbi:hypothetical protein D048_1010A, partial [Vibrio parahaemolyticus VPTS-2009]